MRDYSSQYDYFTNDRGLRKLKVLTVRQPWASLIGFKEKEIETRSWKTNYRGTLYIHAGKSIETDICHQNLFIKALNKHGIFMIQDMPTGVIIAKCNLVDIQRIKENDGINAVLENHWMVIGNEYEFGDYTEGRYAWILKDIELLDKPIPAKGKLSLWEYKE